MNKKYKKMYYAMDCPEELEDDNAIEKILLTSSYLREIDAKAIRMVYIEDKTLQETANNLGLSKKRLKLYLNRGLKHLMTVLAEEKEGKNDFS